MPIVKWRDPDTGEMKEKEFPYTPEGKEEARRYAAELAKYGVPSDSGGRVLERLRPGDIHPEQMEMSSGNYRLITRDMGFTPEDMALFEKRHDPEARRAMQNARAQEARRKAAKRAQVTTAKAAPKK